MFTVHIITLLFRH